MPILISDATVVHDLDRGRLLTALADLPEAFFVPDMLIDKDISPGAASTLRASGVRVVSLDGRELADAIAAHRGEGTLSLGECCALAFARVRRCGMLTTYGELRSAALNQGISVCCALWCLDQIQAAALRDTVQLYAALQAMVGRSHHAFPPDQVTQRITRLDLAERAATTKARA